MSRSKHASSPSEHPSEDFDPTVARAFEALDRVTPPDLPGFQNAGFTNHGDSIDHADSADHADSPDHTVTVLGSRPRFVPARLVAAAAAALMLVAGGVLAASLVDRSGRLDSGTASGTSIAALDGDPRPVLDVESASESLDDPARPGDSARSDDPVSPDSDADDLTASGGSLDAESDDPGEPSSRPTDDPWDGPTTGAPAQVPTSGDGGGADPAIESTDPSPDGEPARGGDDAGSPDPASDRSESADPEPRIILDPPTAADTAKPVSFRGLVTEVLTDCVHHLVLTDDNRIEEQPAVVCDSGSWIVVSGARVHTSSGYVPEDQAFDRHPADIRPGDTVTVTAVKTLGGPGLNFSLECVVCQLRIER